MAARPVFIIGMGRSGTNFLARAIAAHPQVRATFEDFPIFQLATDVALFEGQQGNLFGRLAEQYRRQISRTDVPVYLDKSHKDLWCALELKREFPLALFIAIERNPFPCIASWLEGGIAYWHKPPLWTTVSRAFLGINEKTAAGYEAFPPAVKLALRWKANHKRIEYVAGALGEDLFRIWYEDLVMDTRARLDRIGAFLGLEGPIPEPKVDVAPLSKWMTQLSDEDLESIAGILGLGRHERTLGLGRMRFV